jgi:hypothetical protein
MKTDILSAYANLKQKLINERAALQRRLSEINQVLGSSEAPAEASTAPMRPETQARSRRFRSSMTLREAVTRVISEKPLTRKEIVDAIQEIGFRFASKNPMNSLGAFLYSHKKEFKNDGGKFSPTISARKAGAVEATVSPGKNGKPKRKMSAAARARIAAGARARWARVKETKASA